MHNTKYKIVVVGLGYVGLSNAILLAQHNKVIGVDISKERVQQLNEGKLPIVDSFMSRFLEEKNLNLTATTDFDHAVIDADFVIISTPTDYNENTNFFDTSSINTIIEKLTNLSVNSTIIIKSTIPIGFVEKAREKFSNNAIIFSPEFLREGNALYDNLYPSRIVIGDQSNHAKIFANLIKQGAVKSDIDTLFTNSSEAEAIKLFSNAYLAMRVAFFNEIDSFALVNNLNCRQIIDGVSLDSRIGSHYNNPSFGYGGYCFPKDTKQLLANFHSVPQNLIQATVDANATRIEFLAKTIIEMRPKIVGVHRLIMKNNSDNFRMSAVQSIMKYIKKNDIEVIIFEPELNDEYFFGSVVEKNFKIFKDRSDLILSNRISEDLYDVSEKIFSRDLFGND